MNHRNVRLSTTATNPQPAASAASEEGRRRTLVSTLPAQTPKLLDRRRRRRTFTATYKVRTLAEVDRPGLGDGGAIVRREGLYTSALTD